MTDSKSEFESRRFPWASMRFELIGVAIAIGAWLAGILLGMVWGPLFWLGAAAAIVTLMATRQSERTPPASEHAMVAPVDGVVTSIDSGTPPVELRLTGQFYQRIRISSSPTDMNGMHAPISGEITSVVTEQGEPSTPFANSPDGDGNAVLYVSLASDAEAVGLVMVAGGFGPRIDMDMEVGDVVKFGRKLGARRLGGWCDVWLPADLEPAVWPGMRLTAAETPLVSMQYDRGAEQVFNNVEPATEVTPPEETAAPDEAAELTEQADDPKSDEAKDPAEMFAELREKVSASTKPDTDTSVKD